MSNTPMRQDPDAVEILRLHERIQTQYSTCVDWAIECGKKLERKKSSMKHGEWLPWVRKHLGEMSERTARMYIQFWENKSTIKDGNALSIRDGLKLISDKKEEPKTATVADLPKTPSKKASNQCSTECSTGNNDPAKQAAEDCKNRNDEEAAGVVTHEEKDVEGFPIPPHLVDFFHRRKEIDDLLHKASTLATTIERMIKEKDPLAAFIHPDHAHRLRLAFKAIKDSRPDIVCWYCDGNDHTNCLSCAGTGFLCVWKGSEKKGEAKRQARLRKLKK